MADDKAPGACARGFIHPFLTLILTLKAMWRKVAKRDKMS